jgi:hypothetical protein
MVAHFIHNPLPCLWMSPPSLILEVLYVESTRFKAIFKEVH